jgi:hypothetical protein
MYKFVDLEKDIADWYACGKFVDAIVPNGSYECDITHELKSKIRRLEKENETLRRRLEKLTR